MTDKPKICGKCELWYAVMGNNNYMACQINKRILPPNTPCRYPDKFKPKETNNGCK